MEHSSHPQSPARAINLLFKYYDLGTMPPLTVGLIGATGRTGGWVLEGCLERGHAVFALVRSPDKMKAHADTSPICRGGDGGGGKKKDLIRVVEGDATSADGVRSLLDAAEKAGSSLDVIVSTVGSSRESIVVKKVAEALVGALGTAAPDAAAAAPRVVWMTSTGVNEATDQAKSYPLFGAPSRWCFGYGAFGWLQFNILIPYVIGQDLWDDMGHSEDVIRADETVSARTVIVRPTNMHPISECPVFSEEWWKGGGTDAELGYVLVGAGDPPPGKWIVRRAIAAALLDLAADASHDGTAKSLFAK